jgi:hypothetical protein
MQNQTVNLPLTSENDLLKNEEPYVEGLRRVVLNRWVPGRKPEHYE